MKLCKSSFEIIEPTGYTLDDIYKSIELAGKVSHKSEHTIKENSAKEFVNRMIKLGHGATLEFGTVYLAIPCEFNGDQYSESWKESKYNSATKTELYMCGYSTDWKYFFELRDDKQHAHPQAYELAHPLHQEFLKRNYIYE